MDDQVIDDEDVAPALLEAAAAYVEDRLLDDPDLNPRAVAEALHVSVRTLYRVFAQQANLSVMAYVRERRLERARAELVATRLSVSELAARWHFADGKLEFHRERHGYHGCRYSPGRFSGTATGPLGTLAPGKTCGEWQKLAADALMIALSVDRDDFDEYQRLGQRWLAEFPQVIKPDLWDNIRIGDPTVDASLGVTPWPGGPIKSERFDLAKFERFVGKLSDPVEELGFLGETEDGDGLDLGVSWSKARNMSFEGIVSTRAESLEGDVMRLVSFIVDFLDDADPAFGCASTHFNAQSSSELDLALRRSHLKSIAASREYLRGYSWLTVVPKELVARLGGVAALREAPLAAVHPLTAGGVVLLASSTPAQYDDVAMRALFRTLAPVLPPGKPEPMPGYGHIRVVYEDASAV